MNQAKKATKADYQRIADTLNQMPADTGLPFNVCMDLFGITLRGVLENKPQHEINHLVTLAVE